MNNSSELFNLFKLLISSAYLTMQKFYTVESKQQTAGRKNEVNPWTKNSKLHWVTRSSMGKSNRHNYGLDSIYKESSTEENTSAPVTEYWVKKRNI